MARYRFYVLNAGDHIGAVIENAACADDGEAGLIADRLLSNQSKHPGIEIRQGERRVSRHYRRPAATGFFKRAAALRILPRWLTEN
jgi:hypothetical protein